MRIALYQPDIPQNTGSILRMAACLGVGVDIIGPAGFDMSDRALRRAGLDYLGHVNLERHISWEDFYIGLAKTGRPLPEAACDIEGAPQPAQAGPDPAGSRLLLLTTMAETSYVDFQFRPGDILLLGRESAGVPEILHQDADARIKIPMKPGLRSLNVAMAAAMVLGEALRQTDGFPQSQ